MGLRLICYRSDKTNGSRDTVLVKDVGVSCSLLKENAVDPGVSITGFENYLVKQLKLEYKELSDITRKINAYTKDILSSLASRYKREDQAVQKSVRNIICIMYLMICILLKNYLRILPIF